MTRFHAELIKRIESQPGMHTPAVFGLAADILAICRRHLTGWTTRLDDAERIPDVLSEAQDALLGRMNASRVTRIEERTDHGQLPQH